MKMIILEENVKWHLEAFASELLIFKYIKVFWVKNDPKSRKYFTSKCSKLSAGLCSLQSGKLVIMFLIPVVLVLRHICTHKEESRLVGYIACEDVRGRDL